METKRVCDQEGCGTLLRSTNPYGRCTPCCIKVGYPKGRVPEPGSHPKAHNEDCVCFDVREMMLDATGAPAKRRAGNKGYQYTWLIEVRCPTCLVKRKVRMDGAGVHLCEVGYEIQCRECGIDAAVQARSKTSRLRARDSSVQTPS